MEGSFEHRYFIIDNILFKNGPLPLIYFHFFQTAAENKNSRFLRDSDSDRQNRRQACWPLDHHHGPIFYALLLNSTIAHFSSELRKVTFKSTKWDEKVPLKTSIWSMAWPLTSSGSRSVSWPSESQCSLPTSAITDPWPSALQLYSFKKKSSS